MALRPESRRRILDFCFNNYFRRECQRFNEMDVRNFTKKNEYFLCEIENVDVEFEFALFHFFKWVRRLGLNFTKSEIRDYFKTRILNTNPNNPQC